MHSMNAPFETIFRRKIPPDLRQGYGGHAGRAAFEVESLVFANFKCHNLGITIANYNPVGISTKIVSIPNLSFTTEESALTPTISVAW